MRLGIRTKLALLVLAVLLPLLAAAAVRVWGDMSEGRRVANQSQLDAANARLQSVTSQLGDMLRQSGAQMRATASFGARPDHARTTSPSVFGSSRAAQP